MVSASRPPAPPAAQATLQAPSCRAVAVAEEAEAEGGRAPREEFQRWGVRGYARASCARRRMGPLDQPPSTHAVADVLTFFVEEVLGVNKPLTCRDLAPRCAHTSSCESAALKETLQVHRWQSHDPTRRAASVKGTLMTIHRSSRAPRQQQTVATPTCRERIGSPCRYFKIYSRYRLGSCYRVSAAFQTLCIIDSDVLTFHRWHRRSWRMRRRRRRDEMYSARGG